MYGMNPTYSLPRIVELCGDAAQQVTIELVAETGSTNADLLADLDQLTAPKLLVAEMQTAGRGRAGRVWYSAPGATLTFSLAWKLKMPVQALVGLPLAVGVVIAEVLTLFEVEARLKWPNDVLRDGQKLAGILIETAAAKNGAATAVWVVIGIGLNMVMPAALAAQIRRSAAAAPVLKLDSDLVIATLLNALSEALLEFEQHGFKLFMPRWNRLHAHTGQAVAIIDRGRILYEGQAVGVDDIGRLLLDTADGQIAVLAGDVSLQVAGA